MQGITAVNIYGPGVDFRRPTGGTVFQQDGVEIEADGVQDGSQDTNVGGNARYRAESDIVSFQPLSQIGAKKSGKPRFWQPQIFRPSVQFCDNFGPFGSGQGMGLHSARKDKVFLMECIRRENDGPFFIPENADQVVYRLDDPSSEESNGKVFAVVEIILYHVYYQESRPLLPIHRKFLFEESRLPKGSNESVKRKEEAYKNREFKEHHRQSLIQNSSSFNRSKF
jgi:hypothetical protein